MRVCRQAVRYRPNQQLWSMVLNWKHPDCRLIIRRCRQLDTVGVSWTLSVWTVFGDSRWYLATGWGPSVGFGLVDQSWMWNVVKKQLDLKQFDSLSAIAAVQPIPHVYAEIHTQEVIGTKDSPSQTCGGASTAGRNWHVSDTNACASDQLRTRNLSDNI